MVIQGIQSETLNVINHVSHHLSETVSWLGHHVKMVSETTGNIVVNAWNKASPAVVDVFKQFFRFMRTGPGLCSALLVAGLTFYSSGEAINDKSVAVWLRVTGVACFFAAGAVLGAGLIHGIGKPLI